jgi:glycine/D-amino acid oxidase-like deaminating enzyme
MGSNSGQSTSIWNQTKVPTQATLDRDFSGEVCVVGAGIAGMTTAYLLGCQGKSVIVLDDGPIGGGQTERTTAHLANAIDDNYCEIERLHGEDGAKLAAESHTAAIERVEKIVGEEQIDCDFVRLDGYLFAPPNESLELLERELAAAHRAGLTDVEQVRRAPLDGFNTGPCLRFPRQGQFHPLKYLSGLAKSIGRNGGRVFTDAHVEKVTGGSSALVQTSRGFKVAAAAVVVATNTPINDLVAVHTSSEPRWRRVQLRKPSIGILLIRITTSGFKAPLIPRVKISLLSEAKTTKRDSMTMLPIDTRGYKPGLLGGSR